MKLSDNIILHDSFAFKGGGERLVYILCRELKSDLAFGDRSPESFGLDTLSGRLIDLDARAYLPLWRTFKRFNSFLRKTRFLKNYKTIVYIDQDAPLAVGNHPDGENIYYCHAPPRSIYDLKETHFLGVKEGRLLETLVGGETGMLLPRRPSSEDIVRSICELDTRRARFMREACEKRAEKFRTEIFAEKMRQMIQ